MESTWVWDRTLFGGSARYYRRGRLPYSPEIAGAFQEELSLDGTGRLLDVGCGTGEIALLLAPLYAEVVGLDADEEMIEEARAEAERQDRRNTRWVTALAEELPLDLGTFRTATFAQSFHWMDRESASHRPSARYSSRAERGCTSTRRRTSGLLPTTPYPIRSRRAPRSRRSSRSTSGP